MGDLATVVAVVAVLWTIGAFIWTGCLKGDVAADHILRYSIFMLISSVIVFGLASFALTAAYQSTLTYAVGILQKAMQGKPLNEASAFDIQAAAQYAANHANNLYLARLALVEAAAATLKYFIPAILAALGVWALGQYMGYRIRLK